MITLLQQLENEVAFAYTLILGRLFACSLFDIVRLTSLALLAVLLGKLLLQGFYVRRLLAQATTPDPGDPHDAALLRAWHETAAGLGLRRTPRLRFYHHPRLPAFTVGVRRPIVFLAPGFSRGLEPEEQRAVLAHELGHVRRGDNLTTWLLELVFAALPAAVVALLAGHVHLTWAGCWLILGAALLFLGGYRLLLRGLYRARCEHACDDLSIAQGNPPLVLAGSLLKAWRWMTADHPPRALPVVHALLKGPTCLERRVGRLADYRGPVRGRRLERAFRLGLAVLIACFGLFLLQYHVLGTFDAQITQWSAGTCCRTHSH